jgi:hypothetical protein
MNNTKNNAFSLRKFLAKKDQDGRTYLQDIGIAVAGISFIYLIMVLFIFLVHSIFPTVL